MKEFFYFYGVDDEIKDLLGVSMNEDFIFFWSRNLVWKLALKTRLLTKIPVQISTKEKDTFKNLFDKQQRLRGDLGSRK